MTTITDSATAIESVAEATLKPRNVAELVGFTLAKLGVGHTFGVVGSGNFVVTNALRRAGVPFTAARHEGGAATMADAYGRMSGKVGLVSTHQGCGLSNAATGIGESAKSRTPMIVVTADTPAAAVRSNFHIDQDGLARSMGAVAERIHGAQSAVADTVRAYRTAVNERRTVVLSLPTDLQAIALPEDYEFPVISLRAPLPVKPHDSAVRELSALIRAAKRPIFVAGRGGRDAKPEIAALAHASGALLATSAVAHGLFNDEPFNLGISGGFSSPFTAETISNADLIVGFGCALNMWTMRHGALISGDARLVQVDLDDSALGANRPIDLGILGDCGETAKAVLDELKSGVPLARGLRTHDMADSIARHARWNSVDTQDISTETSIDPRVLSRELDSMLPAERIVSIDSGNFMGYPSNYLSVPDEFGFCFTQAFQSIGLGLYTAIGAAAARPDRLPILGTGDGGFLMGISELETAVREQIPLVIIVYNDSAYGAEVHHFKGTDDELSIVRFPQVDIASIARGYGAEALTVRTVGDLAGVNTWLSGQRQGPLVIDARIASDDGAWWLAEAFISH